MNLVDTKGPDSGKVYCTAVNSVAKVNSSAELMVKGKIKSSRAALKAKLTKALLRCSATTIHQSTLRLNGAGRVACNPPMDSLWQPCSSCELAQRIADH
jgi:hypothetical protein